MEITGPCYLDRDHKEEFEQVFKNHFRGLHAYAHTVVRDSLMAEEIVQNVFCRLWEKQEQVAIAGSLTGYLYQSVYHEGLNYLKHLKVRHAYRDHVMQQAPKTENGLQHLELRELEEKLAQALKELPEKCRTIFQMSRFEDLKYQEIADRLGIPLKSVENQMGKALRLLRLKLVDFLPASWIVFFLTL